MAWRGFGISDVGRKRENNEDCYCVNSAIGLFVVADGMGGHAGGEFASRMAISTIEEVMSLYHDGPDAHAYYLRDSENIAPEVALAIALRMANERVYKESQAQVHMRGMGTTTAALYLRADKAYLAHVGDSRIYRLRKGSIKQMTDDHSLVNEQLRQGIITAEEARQHQFKNVITRSIGIQETVDVDTFSMDTKPGDRFLLCSDGLSNMVPDKGLERVLRDMDIIAAGRRLIALAVQQGGDDNITCVLAEVTSL